MSALAGKTAIVTGAGGGLGQAYALALADGGAAVVVNDIGDTTQTIQAICARGGQAIGLSASVVDWSAMVELVEAAVERFGSLDIVVNNAGIARHGSMTEETAQAWSDSLDINLTGMMGISRVAATHWIARGPAAGRAIVNIASPAATYPFPGGMGYVASKAAVLGLTQAMAQELAPLGVRVNALCPIARTDMVRGSEAMTAMMPIPESGFDPFLPEHVAPVVAYLASPRCRFTGRVFGAQGDSIAVFGGWTVVERHHNGREQWSIEGVEAALANTAVAQPVVAQWPGVYLETTMPPDETLQALATLSATA
jgi:NAD(P)-dependent dehydrogenase (short-subunit alcohol dehydrogenase family)